MPNAKRPSAPAARREKPPRESRALRTARAAKILDMLEDTHPDARCALDYATPFQLVAATILSAQCTDERVNQVTPELFRRYPDARALAEAPAEVVEELIRPTGFFRAKTKSLLGCARALVADHDGVVPRTMAEMVKLPGVGRKTSNVVLGHAYDIAEGIAVDTHVLRVSNRLGLAQGDDAVEVEQQLLAIVPPERWTRTTDLIIFHGRRICIARRPLCGKCPVFALCRWPQRQAFALGETPRVPRPSRKTAARKTGTRRARA
jgi:endonuclease III